MVFISLCFSFAKNRLFRCYGSLVIYCLSSYYLVIIFQPLIPIITYHLDYNFIVKNVCINRDRPWMHCNGKCYLHKQLDDVFEGIQKHPQNLSMRDFKFSEFTEQINGYSLACPVIISQEPFAVYHNYYHLSLYSKIFRPPQQDC